MNGNEPTQRWTYFIETPELQSALSSIGMAIEDRAELQVRRFCWWLGLQIEDHGSSPGPFKLRVPELHILRGTTCIVTAGSWRQVLDQMIGWRWSPNYIHQVVAACACEPHTRLQASADACTTDRRHRRSSKRRDKGGAT